MSAHARSGELRPATVNASAPPKILVVIPTLGHRAELLRKAAASVRMQGGCDVDLVLVSPPSEMVDSIANEFGARLVLDPGRGLSAALNEGLGAASEGTEFFGWLGDDDLLREGALQATATGLQRQPKAVLVYGWCDYIDDDDVTFFSSRAGRWAARLLAWGPDLVPQPGSLMRLSAVEAVEGLDESLRFAMDLDLFLKLRRVGRLISLPQTLSAFRWHGDSLTVANQGLSADEADRVRRRHLSQWASLTWPVWRWPLRWSLAGVKLVVKRRAAALADSRLSS